MNNSSIKRISSQHGWTMWSMLFVMTVLFIFAYIGMQMVPIMSANLSIKTSMLDSVQDKDLRTISRAKIVRSMDKQLNIDGISGLLDYKDELIMTRSGKEFVLEAKYEREIPLLSNMFLVVRLNPKVECQLNGRCEP